MSPAAKPKAKAKAEALPKPKATTKATTKATAKTKEEATAKTKEEAKPKATTKATAKPKAQTKPKAKAKVATAVVEEPEIEEAVAVADDAVDDELSEQDEIDLKRLDAALATLDDEALRRGLSGVTEKQRQELALHLNLPRATMHLGEALTPLVRRKLRGLTVDRQLMVAGALTNRTNDSTVRALGDRSDDPTRADLEEVLPAVVEEHGIELARLMVASYAVSDAPCRDAMRDILDTDERFAIPEVADSDAEPEETALPSFGLVAQTPRKKQDVDPERARLLELRKAQKAERRAAAQHERAARAAAQAARREALHASKRSHH